MADALLLLHRHVEVADQDQRPLRADALLAAAELARCHVPLHDVHAVLLVEGDAGDLVEAHHIVLADQPALPVRHVDEHFRDRGLAARKQVRVRGELLVHMTLARSAGTEFDDVVVALDEWNQSEQRNPLGPFVQRRGFQAGRTEQEVHPLGGIELAPPFGQDLEDGRARHLDGPHRRDAEGASLLLLGDHRVVLQGDLRVVRRRASADGR